MITLILSVWFVSLCFWCGDSVKSFINWNLEQLGNIPTWKEVIEDYKR